ncbi:MAG: helix-hairpin-helix domain-containing protein [Alteromonadaceae bacterium]|nr:helix-hairpin-helix domain-containing protein [Alteromonadaceae bacterium]
MNKLSAVAFAVFLSCVSSPSIAEQSTKADTESVQVIQVVHLNNADEQALISLKGIGRKKALAIISHREEHGNFKSLNALLDVKGIGKYILVENKERLKL